MSKLAIACELSFNEWLETFPEVIPEAERSKKHEKWKKKLFNKMRNDRYHVFTTKTVKIILVAAILMTLLMTAFVFPSSRESLLDSSNIYSKFKITEHNKNSVNREIKVGYIPEGFELKQKDYLLSSFFRCMAKTFLCSWVCQLAFHHHLPCMNYTQNALTAIFSFDFFHMDWKL